MYGQSFNYFMLVFIFGFYSCEKPQSNNDDLLRSEGMSVTAIETLGDFEGIDTSFITSAYDSQRGLKVKQYQIGKFHEYLGFDNNNSSNDSILIESSLQYKINVDSEFNFSKLELSFIYREAKTNLEAITDSTYRYKNLEILFETLKHQVWGNNPFDENMESVAIIRIPDSYDDWINSPYSSNGFYFDNENFEISNISYEPFTQEILLEGKFNVSLKILSCGYFIFYNLIDATFCNTIN